MPSLTRSFMTFALVVSVTQRLEPSRASGRVGGGGIGSEVAPSLACSRVTLWPPVFATQTVAPSNATGSDDKSPEIRTVAGAQLNARSPGVLPRCKGVFGRMSVGGGAPIAHRNGVVRAGDRARQKSGDGVDRPMLRFIRALTRASRPCRPCVRPIHSNRRRRDRSSERRRRMNQGSLRRSPGA